MGYLSHKGEITAFPTCGGFGGGGNGTPCEGGQPHTRHLCMQTITLHSQPQITSTALLSTAQTFCVCGWYHGEWTGQGERKTLHSN